MWNWLTCTSMWTNFNETWNKDFWGDDPFTKDESSTRANQTRYFLIVTVNIYLYFTLCFFRWKCYRPLWKLDKSIMLEKFAAKNLSCVAYDDKLQFYSNLADEVYLSLGTSFLFFSPGVKFAIPNIFHTSVIKISIYFQGSFGPLVFWALKKMVGAQNILGPPNS